MAQTKKRGLSSIGAGLVALFLTVSGATAQEVDVKQVLERLEKLEKQNEELRNTLQIQQQQLFEQQKRLQEQATPAPQAEAVESPAKPGDLAGPKTDEEALRKIVSEYLDKKSAKGGSPEGKAKDTDPAECQTCTTKDGEAKSFEVGKNLAFTASWKDGIWFSTVDKAFTFHVGGRIDFDQTWYGGSKRVVNSIGVFNNYLNPDQGLQDGWDIRRFRIRLDGSMWEQMDYRVETDLANAIDLRRRTLGISPTPAASGTIDDQVPAPAVRMTDVYLEWRDMPYLGTLRVGHQREMLTFTAASSENFQLFMERSLMFTAFNNDFLFDNGIVLYRNFLNDRMYAWLGIFRPSDPNSNDDSSGGFSLGDGKYAYDARVTFLPVWLDNGYRWLMVGGAYSCRGLEFDQARFRANPEVQSAPGGFLVPNIINTGAILTPDPEQYFNLQLASGWGRLSFTTEWSCVNLTNTYTGTGALILPPPNATAAQLRAMGLTRHGSYFAQGFYCEAMYFLTDDHRTFRLGQPAYDRVNVNEKAFWTRGPCGSIFGRGAWEIGARYDWLDLSNAGINGGFANAITLGVNWHWNANMKVQWNYIWMTRNFEPTDTAGRQKGDFDGFGMRFHVDF